MKANSYLILFAVLAIVSTQSVLPVSRAEAAAADEKPQQVEPVLDEPLRLDIVCVKSKRHLTFGQLCDRLIERDLICIGEKHDSELHHRVQLQIIKALYARDERLGVGMEMFQKPYQTALDRYLSGKTDEQTFLKESEYEKRWGYDWKLYRPIVEFSRRNDIPVAALNASSELISRIYKVGLARLTDAEKRELGPVDFKVKAHRDYWYKRLSKLHGQDNASAEEKQRSYEIMTVWDDYMAQSAASFKKDRHLKRMVILAGSGHSEYRFGIPQRVAGYARGTVASVGILVEGVDDLKTAEMNADYLVIVRTSRPAEPQKGSGCKAGRHGGRGVAQTDCWWSRLRGRFNQRSK